MKAEKILARVFPKAKPIPVLLKKRAKLIKTLTKIKFIDKSSPNDNSIKVINIIGLVLLFWPPKNYA